MASQVPNSGRSSVDYPNVQLNWASQRTTQTLDNTQEANSPPAAGNVVEDSEDTEEAAAAAEARRKSTVFPHEVEYKTMPQLPDLNVWPPQDMKNTVIQERIKNTLGKPVNLEHAIHPNSVDEGGAGRAFSYLQFANFSEFDKLITIVGMPGPQEPGNQEEKRNRQKSRREYLYAGLHQVVAMNSRLENEYDRLTKESKKYLLKFQKQYAEIKHLKEKIEEFKNQRASYLNELGAPAGAGVLETTRDQTTRGGAGPASHRESSRPHRDSIPEPIVPITGGEGLNLGNLRRATGGGFPDDSDPSDDEGFGRRPIGPDDAHRRRRQRRDQNADMHDRLDRLERQMTPSAHTQATGWTNTGGGDRAPRTRDPETFSGEDKDTQKLDRFLSQCSAKLKAAFGCNCRGEIDTETCPHEENRILFIINSTDGNAFKTLRLQSPDNTKCPRRQRFYNVAEVIECLQENFGEPLAHVKARQRLHRMKMSPREDFRLFWARFNSEKLTARMNDDEALQWLKQALPTKMVASVTRFLTVDHTLRDFTNECVNYEIKQSEIDDLISHRRDKEPVSSSSFSKYDASRSRRDARDRGDYRRTERTDKRFNATKTTWDHNLDSWTPRGKSLNLEQRKAYRDANRCTRCDFYGHAASDDSKDCPAYKKFGSFHNQDNRKREARFHATALDDEYSDYDDHDSHSVHSDEQSEEEREKDLLL